jgi:ParB family chromosome partitioning protein
MTDKPPRTRGLGRGLSALMSDITSASESSAAERPRRPDMVVPVESLHANPNQPRRSFPSAQLDELAASIREKGIIQPLIVRPHPTEPQAYEIVAGERRWRAAQIAQLHDVPVILRSYSDTEVLEVAIIENIQRADLNPIDEGAGYRALMDRFGHTQEQLSTALGKSRSHIANLMRLLTLPDDVQSLVSSGTLTAGHARALIGHPEASLLAKRVAMDKLSVRETEALARKPFKALRDKSGRQAPIPKDPDTVQLENELSAMWKMSITIEQSQNEEGGRVILRYTSLAQLDDLLRALSGH